MGNTIKTCSSKEEFCTTFHGLFIISMLKLLWIVSLSFFGEQ